jgi:hypothetical protein
MPLDESGTKATTPATTRLHGFLDIGMFLSALPAQAMMASPPP